MEPPVTRPPTAAQCGRTRAGLFPGASGGGDAVTATSASRSCQDANELRRTIIVATADDTQAKLEANKALVHSYVETAFNGHQPDRANEFLAPT